MERRIPTRLPDAINASPDSNFTQIRNDMLRDPRISCKAKGILCILLSHQVNGLVSVNNLETLHSICKEGYNSIQSGLIELEEAGYFTRIRYRDKKTKRIKPFGYVQASGGINGTSQFRKKVGLPDKQANTEDLGERTRMANQLQR